MNDALVQRGSSDIDRVGPSGSDGLDILDDDQAVIMQPSIDRDRAARYFFRANLLVHALITLATFGLWGPFLLLWMAGFGQWYAKRRSLELDYRLLPGRLLVSDGVFTKVRKTIPLDKVTDIGLVQGIVDRWFALWRVSVQTASSGQAAPEAVLVGLRDPREFRRGVLAQRERWLESGDAPISAPEVRAISSATGDLGGERVERRLAEIERLLAKIAENTRR
jgi:membrane protein YdbS with pleckstrin-like domain